MFPPGGLRRETRADGLRCDFCQKSRRTSGNPFFSATFSAPPAQLKAHAGVAKALWFASSSESRGNGREAKRFAELLKLSAHVTLQWHYEPMPEEAHSTIYHPAALRAFRVLFKPAAKTNG